jgi:hypothetical protein
MHVMVVSELERYMDFALDLTRFEQIQQSKFGQTWAILNQILSQIQLFGFVASLASPCSAAVAFSQVNERSLPTRT